MERLGPLAARALELFTARMFHLALPLALSLTACGPEAPVYHGPTTQAPVPQQPNLGNQSQTTRDVSNANVNAAPAPTTNKAAPPKNDAPADAGKTPAPPSTALAPVRTAPNAAEKQAMQALYALPAAQGGCADCHGALANSAKKGRTAQQLQAAQTLAPHRNVAAANKWPKDVADTSNDGVDNAQLQASAMAEVLK